jgi:hypothetical protein
MVNPGIDVMKSLQQSPLIHSLIRLELSGTINTMRSFALVLPLMTSLRKLSIAIEIRKLAVLDPIPTLHFPPTLRHLKFIDRGMQLPSLILILPKDHRCAMNLVDIMKSWPNLDHVEYQRSYGDSDITIAPISSIVKWKSFNGGLSKHQLPLMYLSQHI